MNTNLARFLKRQLFKRDSRPSGEGKIGLLSFRRNIYTKKVQIQIGQGIAIIIRTKGELILSSIPDTASGLTFSN